MFLRWNHVLLQKYKHKNMARKKTGRNPKSFSEAVGFRNKYQSDTTDFFLGFFLLAVAVYVVIAMVSYLSTGQADQSTLENMRPGEILNSNHEFRLS